MLKLKKYYQALGLNTDRLPRQPYSFDDLQEIRQAFEAKAKELYPTYPDRNPSDAETEKQWAKLIQVKLIILDNLKAPKFVTDYFFTYDLFSKFQTPDFNSDFSDKTAEELLKYSLNVNEVPKDIVSYFEAYMQALGEQRTLEGQQSQADETASTIKINSIMRILLNIAPGRQKDFRWPLSQEEVKENLACKLFIHGKLKFTDLVQLKEFHLKFLQKENNFFLRQVQDELTFFDLASLKEFHLKVLEDSNIVNGLVTQGDLKVTDLARLQKFHLEALEKRGTIHKLITDEESNKKLNFSNLSQLKEFHLEALEGSEIVKVLFTQRNLEVIDLARLQKFHLEALEKQGVVYKLLEDEKLNFSDLAKLKEIHIKALEHNEIVNALFTQGDLEVTNLALLKKFHLEVLEKRGTIHKLITDEESNKKLNFSNFSQLKEFHLEALEGSEIVKALFTQGDLEVTDLARLQKFHLEALEKRGTIHKLITDEGSNKKLNFSNLSLLKEVHLKALEDNAIINKLFTKGDLEIADLARLQKFHLEALEKQSTVYELLTNKNYKEKINFPDFAQLQEFHLQALEDNTIINELFTKGDLEIADLARLQKFHLEALRKQEVVYELITDKESNKKLNFSNLSQLKEFHLSALENKKIVYQLFTEGNLEVTDLARLQKFHLEALEKQGTVYKLLTGEKCKEKINFSDFAQLQEFHLQALEDKYIVNDSNQNASEKQRGTIYKLIVEDKKLSFSDLAKLDKFYLKDLDDNESLYELFSQGQLKIEYIGKLKELSKKQFAKFLKENLTHIDEILDQFSNSEKRQFSLLQFLYHNYNQNNTIELSFDEIYPIMQDQLAQAIYEKMIDQLKWDEKDKTLKNFDYFIKSEGFKYFTSEVLKPFSLEIQRIKDDNKEKIGEIIDEISLINPKIAKIRTEIPQESTESPEKSESLESSKISQTRAEILKIDAEIAKFKDKISSIEIQLFRGAVNQPNKEEHSKLLEQKKNLHKIIPLLEKQKKLYEKLEKLHEKPNELRKQLNELRANFINNACSLISEKKTEKQLLEEAKNKFVRISNGIVNSQRNPVGDVIKGLLGTIIAVPCGLIPMFFETFTDFFFQTKSYAFCNRTHSNLQKKCDEYTKGNLNSFFKPAAEVEPNSVQGSTLNGPVTDLAVLVN
jgi:hypothetical protein